MTDTEAADAINAVVAASWTGATAIVGIGKADALRWQGKEETGNPTGYWARVSQQIVDQPQTSFADENTFGANQKRYETVGLVFVQLFAPKSEKNASPKGFRVAQMLRDAFRTAGQSGSLWFQNARINPLPEDGSSYRWNVVSEFKYDTIG